MQANSAVQILSTTMVATQREALTKQHDMILTFDVANRRMRMIWDANSNSIIDAGERSRTIPLDNRLAFGRGGARRGFRRRRHQVQPDNQRVARRWCSTGTAAPAGIGGFYATSTRAVLDGTTKWNRDSRAVEIVRATGRTEWFKYNGTAWTRGF